MFAWRCVPSPSERDNARSACVRRGVSRDERVLKVMSEQTSQRTVVLTNPQGLHARPAHMFVKLATKFESSVELIKDSERVDGKSILAILTLAAGEGSTLSIEATGRDAEQALDALVQLVAQNFAEDEHK